MRRAVFVFSALALAGASSASAQQVRVFTRGTGDMIATAGANGDRAMIGVSTSAGSKRDTLGVLVSSLTAGGPAEKSGLSEGDRIQSINSVSLKVSRDDAGDAEMSGIMQRRLTRELGKVKAGDEVTLQVWHEGASKTYKLKTVASEDLQPRKVSAAAHADRAVIGIGFGLTGNKRDTAGVFVNSVAEDGPAEKAGIVEGDRIAAINGVSLKLSKDDLEDSWVASSRLSRLSREVAKAKPGDVMELTIISGGRARPVKVTLAKASTLKSSGDGAFSIFRSPDAPMPPMPPGFTFSAPTPPEAPHPPRTGVRLFSGDDAEIQVQIDGLRGEIEQAMRTELPRVRAEMRRGILDAQQALEQARQQMQMTTVTLRTHRTVRI